MQSIRTQSRRVATVLSMVALAACESKIPTVVGENGFPSGQIPTTVDLVVPASAFVTTDTVFEGYESLNSASYLLLANAFEGALTSHGLVRFTGFPDSVTFTSGGTTRTDRNFTYGAARVTAVVDTAATFPRATTTLQLFSLTQAWDSSTVSWRNAVDRPGSRTPWRTPGGTVGGLVAQANWVPTDTARRDSVSWVVDSLTVRRLARGELAGLLVRTATAGSRVEISDLTLDATIRPASRADTVLTQRITAGPQTFIFTPDAPTSATALRTGGVAGARTVLRLNLAQTVPTCPPPQSGPRCRQVPIRDVTLNQVTLLLDPLAVPSGFRPIAPTSILVRRLLEPELGSVAPLGEVLAEQTIPATAFSAAGRPAISFNLTGPAREAIGTGSPMLDLVFLSNLGTSNFGTAWFGATPRLRLLYTVPAALQLP